jgi:tRNA threonylcarbamoyladenosine biosynthesis protein TsaB
MLILGIDTSGKSGGITLAQGDVRSFHVLESSPIEGGMFSAQLVPTLAAMLARKNLEPTALGGIAVISGPGSFTGLRVGLSAVKGLAEALNKPIATVSLLEALAVASGEHGRVAAALDAGRQEVYFGLCDVSAGRAAVVSERLFSQDEFIDELKNTQPVCLATSDHAIVEVSYRVRVKICDIDRPGSRAAAEIGVKKLLAGETVSAEALDANYIRRSDAEIFFKSSH